MGFCTWLFVGSHLWIVVSRELIFSVRVFQRESDGKVLVVEVVVEINKQIHVFSPDDDDVTYVL